MKNNSYRILKLKSGEELIARIAGQKRDKLIIERPMIFKSSTMTDPYGRTKELTVLKNWLLYAAHEKTSIPKDFVVSFLKPDMDVLELYELEKRKDDFLKSKKKNRIIKDPRGPRNSKNNKPSKFKGVEEIEKLMNLFNKNSNNKNMMEEFIDSMENLSDEDLAEMRRNSMEDERTDSMEDDDYVNYITMTLFLPPEALLSLVDSGLIEEKQLKEIIDALHNGKMDGNNMDEWGGVYSPFEERNPDEYGNSWKDWSPFPTDYLGDPDLD